GRAANKSSLQNLSRYYWAGILLNRIPYARSTDSSFRWRRRVADHHARCGHDAGDAQRTRARATCGLVDDARHLHRLSDSRGALGVGLVVDLDAFGTGV